MIAHLGLIAKNENVPFFCDRSETYEGVQLNKLITYSSKSINSPVISLNGLREFDFSPFKFILNQIVVTKHN